MNNLEDIKENFRIFLDQNISSEVLTIMLKNNYKHVDNVFTTGYISANDGKLFRLIKKHKMILVTYDKKFNKMAIKYGLQSILLRPMPNGQFCSSRRVFTKVQCELIHIYSALKKYYANEKV